MSTFAHHLPVDVQAMFHVKRLVILFFGGINRLKEKIMIEEKEVSSAEVVASIVSGTGKTRNKMVVRTITYRVSIGTLARVDSMAGKSGKSRNAMLNLLLDVGIDEVYKLFTHAEVEELQSREIMAYQALDGDSDILEE